MSTEIYYFSGTGNSLHVAKELRKRIPETRLIPLISLLNRDVIETKGDTVGFVFPIHFVTLPMILKKLIKKMDLKSAQYIFAVATRYGTPCGTAFSKIEKILNKQGKCLDAYLVFNMVSNDPKFDNWEPPTQEKIDGFEADIQERLNSFQNSIINKVRYREEDTRVTFPVNSVFEKLGSLMIEVSGDPGKDLYADTKCSGCGTCEKVCLAQKIKMIDQAPVWQKDVRCFSCYACLNFCPVQSVQLKSGRLIKFYTDKNGRYHHPDATVNDIAAQK